MLDCQTPATRMSTKNITISKTKRNKPTTQSEPNPSKTSNKNKKGTEKAKEKVKEREQGKCQGKTHNFSEKGKGEKGKEQEKVRPDVLRKRN